MYNNLRMDIEKQLTQRLNIHVEGGKRTMVLMKYEKLTSFYFGCGLIRHMDRFCKTAYGESDGIVKRKYGPEI